MNCEVDYCIYNIKLSCILEEIQINSLGMCEDCIIVSVPNDILNGLKEKQLEDINSRWGDYE